MTTLADRATQQIADIDAQIQRARDRAQAEIAALQAKKALLVNAMRILTPTIETVVAGLEQNGLIKLS